MTVTLENLIDSYEKLLSIVSDNTILNNSKHSFDEVKTMFNDKIANPEVKIIVYGVYNAGKSTLINVMVGKEVAAVDDIPLTDSITEYSCGNYKIIDTPGIDAPLEHEELTLKEMLKADAIIFVVNPAGVIEEQKTLDTLLELLQQGKKIFLIFNEKSALSDEDYLFLKEQTQQRLQVLATERGMSEVLKDVPICKINAKTALKARIKGSEKLLQHSGYLIFEQDLEQFINTITDKDVNERLTSRLSHYLKGAIESLESSSSDSVVKSYDQLIKDIKINKIDTRKEMKKRTKSKEDEIHQQIKSWLSNEDKDTESKVKDKIEQSCTMLETELRDSLDIASTLVQGGIDELQTKMPDISFNPLIDQSNIKNPLNIKNEIQDTDFSEENTSVNLDNIKMVATTIQHSVKVEHIVSGLNLVKTYLPTLMKGIGEKTIEKMATTMVAKAIPIVGTVVTIGFAAKDIFSEDTETAECRRQQESQRKAIERWEQQIEDVSKDIAGQFYNSLLIAFNGDIDAFFDNIINKLNNLQSEFSEKDKYNSQLLEKIYEIQHSLIVKRQL